MAKKILVCQHVAHEVLGTLDPLFRLHGFRIRYVNFDRDPCAVPNLKGYDGLIVLGGPMNVDETDTYPHLNCEVQLIQEALKQDKPILGICLGAQLLAFALGANVIKNPVSEIGWYDLSVTAAGHGDPLFQYFRPCEKIFQWHGYTFALPKNAVHLASSSLCANQSFRFGDKVYGFQFHLEVDEPMILRWLKVAQNAREIENLRGEIKPETIKTETETHIARSLELSKKCFTEFIHLFGHHKKAKLLKSK